MEETKDMDSMDKDKELTLNVLEHLILDFDIINSTPTDARNFIAWLQVELKSKKNRKLNNK